MSQVKALSRKRLMTSAGMIFLIAMAAITPWRLVAEDREQSEKPKVAASQAGYDLSQVVKFEIGQTQLPKGDSITIEEVRGTADTMTAGNLYEVKGTYVLNSADKAMLAAFTTVNANDPLNEQFKNVPIQKTQTAIVEKAKAISRSCFTCGRMAHPTSVFIRPMAETASAECISVRAVPFTRAHQRTSKKEQPLTPDGHLPVTLHEAPSRAIGTLVDEALLPPISKELGFEFDSLVLAKSEV